MKKNELLVQSKKTSLAYCKMKNKITKKLLFLFIISFLATFSTNAQDFSLGINASSPSGDISDAYNLNLGIDASLLNTQSRLFFGGTVSYSVFLGDEFEEAGVTVDVEDISFLEIKLTLEYEVSDLLYLSFSGGLATLLEEDNDSSDGENIVYSPIIGLKFDEIRVFGIYKTIDISDGSFDNIGIGLAYSF